MADNDKIIKCPACGCEMEKIFMPKAGINLDVCTNGCGGIYFDNREFKEFDEPHEDISPLIELLKNKEFKTVDENETRYCPVCGSAMMKNYASAEKDVQVDECYSCGGKFLDYGEIKKIRSINSPYNIEKTKDIFKDLYENAGLELIEEKKRRNQKSKTIKYTVRILFAILIIVLASLFLIKLGYINKLFNF